MAASTAVDLSLVGVGADTLVRSEDGGLLVSCLGGSWTEAIELPLPQLSAPAVTCATASTRCGYGEISIMADHREIHSCALAGRGVQTYCLPMPQTRDALRLVIRVVGTGGPLVARLAQVTVEPVVPQPVLSTDLIALYDLNHRTAGYAGVLFALAAEARREAGDLQGVRQIIVPETAVGERRLGESFRRAYPSDVRHAFVTSLLSGLAELLPGWRTPEVIDDRRIIEGLLYSAPLTYGSDPHLGVKGPVIADFYGVLQDGSRADGRGRLAAPRWARDEVGEWLRNEAQGRRVITLFPRGEAYEPEANTDVDAWRAWANDRSECIVIVADPRHPRADVPAGPWILPPWNDLVRNQALFEHADLNLASYGEHSLPLLASKAAFVMWVPVDATDGMFSGTTLRSAGFVLDGRTPMLMSHQQLVFRPPTPVALDEAVASN